MRQSENNRLKRFRLYKRLKGLLGMKYGYSRVSTTDQNLTIQIEALKQYGCETIRKENSTYVVQLPLLLIVYIIILSRILSTSQVSTLLEFDVSSKSKSAGSARERPVTTDGW